jgi:hypothetical protein
VQLVEHMVREELGDQFAAGVDVGLVVDRLR